MLAGISESHLKATLKKTGKEIKYTMKSFAIAEYDCFIKKSNRLLRDMMVQVCILDFCLVEKSYTSYQTYSIYTKNQMNQQNFLLNWL